jgi:hypothetical protein
MARTYDLLEPTQDAMRALVRSIAPHPEKRPAEPVPPQIAAAGRILSRQPGPKPLFTLHGSICWSELDAALSLAYAALATYDREMRDDFYEDDVDEEEEGA